MFRLITVVCIVFSQWYLMRRFLRYISATPVFPRWTKKVTIFAFIFFNAPLPFIYLYFWRLTYMPSDVLNILMPFFIWHLATLFIFFVLALMAMVKVPLILAKNIIHLYPKTGQKLDLLMKTKKYQQFDSTRRLFLQKGVIGLSAYSFIGATGGVIGKDEFEILRTTITIPNLPPAFKGFTIGMMSDIHSSIFMNKQDMSDYVTIMNSLGTDLVVVTGDMVNSKVDEVYPFAEAFTDLKANYGVYGCLGNHDFFTKNVDLVAKEIEECGVSLLRNDAVTIEKEGEILNLIGVDDIGRGVDPDTYLSQALRGVRNTAPKILLCHKPYYFQNALNYNIDLTLSGHTHGGQIVFATVDRTPISFAALASKYVAGLYKLDAAQLYVNKGLGSVGVPFRINCPPELTVITLA